METGTTAASGRKTIHRPPIPWAAQAADDRLSSTLFLAALFHAILILGVTFSGDPGPNDSSAATNLDVVLVTKSDKEHQKPEDAKLLAQTNLTGSGNTSENNQLKTATNRSPDISKVGLDQDGAEERRQGRLKARREPLVITAMTGLNPAQRDLQGSDQIILQKQRATPPGSDTTPQIINEFARETVISGSRDRELIISANTRESRIAAYLSSWKVKVERVGTLNFPNIDRSISSSGHPTLEVVINSNGDLKEVIIRHSSGERVLDQAAMDILRNAAPFDPFPEFLKSDYDVLRFAYEWRFTRGAGVSKITEIGG